MAETARRPNPTWWWELGTWEERHLDLCRTRMTICQGRYDCAQIFHDELEDDYWSRLNDLIVHVEKHIVLYDLARPGWLDRAYDLLASRHAASGFAEEADYAADVRADRPRSAFRVIDGVETQAER